MHIIVSQLFESRIDNKQLYRQLVLQKARFDILYVDVDSGHTLLTQHPRDFVHLQSFLHKIAAYDFKADKFEFQSSVFDNLIRHNGCPIGRIFGTCDCKLAKLRSLSMEHSDCPNCEHRLELKAYLHSRPSFQIVSFASVTRSTIDCKQLREVSLSSISHAGFHRREHVVAHHDSERSVATL